MIENTATHRALIARIKELKIQKNAVIVCHNYQRPEIYEVADFIGDSLGLCEETKRVDCRMIVFSGVYFMAESAAILNPDKKVVIPERDAGCALSDMITAEGLRKKKLEYPDAAVVCYVNSTADVKAESDICCTSSNAVEIVRSLPNRQILMVPDRNLASFVARLVPEKEIIAWDGFCPIHQRITAAYLASAMKDHPDAKIIAHPECQEDVRDMADYVVSTTKMIEVAEKDPASEFYVITECGMANRMKQVLPDKKFYTVCSVCFDMKKNTLEGIERALITEEYEVVVSDEVRYRAARAFDRMFEVSARSGMAPNLLEMT
ncbi:MAG: quinolinate synthase NadA [Patescibacteria group bacterium]